MLADGDHLLVAVSGGVDSLVAAWLLDFWRAKAPISYDLSFVHVDTRPRSGEPGEAAVAAGAAMAALGLPYETVPAAHPPDLDAAGERRKDVCFHCARERRNQLFDLARDKGCGKLVLGHHRDDLLETFLLNLLSSGNLSTMRPRQDLFSGRLAIIRPLAFLDKAEVVEIGRRIGARPVEASCPLHGDTRRRRMRELLARLHEELPGARSSIFAALGNVRADYLLD